MRVPEGCMPMSVQDYYGRQSRQHRELCLKTSSPTSSVTWILWILIQSAPLQEVCHHSTLSAAHTPGISAHHALC